MPFFFQNSIFSDIICQTKKSLRGSEMLILNTASLDPTIGPDNAPFFFLKKVIPLLFMAIVVQ